MNPGKLRRLLAHVADGSLMIDEAVRQLRHQPIEDLGYAQVDTHRALRTGFAEVIYCTSKTPAQIAGIAERIVQSGDPLIATKASEAAFEAVRAVLPAAEFDPTARMITLAGREPTPKRGHVTVLSGGTSDMPIAEEAALTADVMGAEVERVYDAGVAGLHRLLASRAAIDAADAIVAVAGMEGALPSVVGGLTDRPVIAVPTSVGYGAAFGGLAALLGMLNSCAPGVSVVNIDNGFGAGFQAALIAARSHAEPPA